MPEEEVECLYKALVDNVITDDQIIEVYINVFYIIISYNMLVCLFLLIFTSFFLFNSFCHIYHKTKGDYFQLG
jgi:hypothetical protein